MCGMFVARRLIALKLFFPGLSGIMRCENFIYKTALAYSYGLYTVCSIG